MPLLSRLIGGRVDGPLFRTRAEFAKPLCSSIPNSSELATRFDAYLTALPRREVHTEQDRKMFFRRFLHDLGGISKDRLAGEFKAVLGKISNPPRVKMYDLRHTVTQSMKDSGMPHVDLRYLTSHTTSDIINSYVSLNPAKSMAMYFDKIPGVLSAIEERATEFGLTTSQTANATGLLTRSEVFGSGQ